MTLKDLKPGESGVITEVGGTGELRRHFLDMGVIPGTVVTVEKLAPMGDPMELRIHGYELTLRLADAGEISVAKTAAEEGKQDPIRFGARPHPGLGEDGKYHVKKDEDPLPKDTVLSFALAGNQNCGKTTLFNQLTGSNQHVGNLPGVTERARGGAIPNRPNTEVTDLPGIYSLSPYTGEEVVSRQFILNEKPHGIINIVDATNIERSLYLTMQLLELDIPTVLALNMMDEVKGNGGVVDINEMEALLGIPVVPISALKGDGVEELVEHAIHVAHYRERPGRADFCDKTEHGGAVHKCLHSIMHLIEDRAAAASIPPRFAAAKLVEGDPLVLESLALSDGEKETLEHIIENMEKERGMDRAAAMADMRYSFIRRLCSRAVRHPKESRERIRSRKIDRILTGKWTAIPAFIGIMGLIFFLTFHVIGAGLQSLLEMGLEHLTAAVDGWLSSLGINEALHSLLIDGILGGVGSVLTFIPLIIVLFFFLSLLEDTGYMARVAFVTDKLLRKIGLSGRSIVPMLIGFGCTVPGVMASRTLSSGRDRKMTILLTPFMSCSAKLPIYAFFSAAFFPGWSGLVMTALYFLGILVGILAALVAKNTLFRGEAVPFVMELPNYRLPGVKNVSHLLWDKAKDFLTRAFTVIFLASIAVWFLQSFDFRFNLVSDAENSMLATVAGFIAPIFAPLGFGDWRASTALISGFIAKESVVSTLTVLLGITGENMAPLVGAYTPLAALALLVFSLLYTPCVAAIAAVRRELGGKWAGFMVVFQCAVAWIFAALVRGVGLLFGLA